MKAAKSTRPKSQSLFLMKSGPGLVFQLRNLAVETMETGHLARLAISGFALSTRFQRRIVPQSLITLMLPPRTGTSTRAGRTAVRTRAATSPARLPFLADPVLRQAKSSQELRVSQRIATRA